MMSKSKDNHISRGRRMGGLLLICAAILSLIALVFYHPFDWPAGSHQEEIMNPLKQLGAAGAFILVNFTFGRWGSFIFPLIMFLWGVKLFNGAGKPLIPTLKLLWLGLMVGWALHLISKSGGYLLPEYNFGLISGEVAKTLERFTGFTGAWIITAAALLAMAELTIGLRLPKGLFMFFAGLGARYKIRRESVRSSRARGRRWEKAEEVGESEAKEIPEKPPEKGPRKKIRKGKTAKKPEVPVKATEPEAPPAEVEEEYAFPSTELLTLPDESEEIPDEELRTSAAALEKRLEEFGVVARVVAIHPGPVITRFDLQPAPGVKVNRIVALQDDLSLSMRARSLRILAPIPGEAAVGVEVPNKKIQIVKLRKVIESEAYRKSPSRITMALGVDTSGEPYIADLAEMPHLLVAGTTGSGKSVCLNAILASILFRARPEEVRFALIDPKKLELKMYVPLLEHHLIAPPGVKEPVVTEPDGALKVLKSLEIEMQIRYNKLSEKGHRSLEEYNRNRDNTRLPYIVMVVDELADLIMTAGGAIETPIARLAQMGRAVGIHLIVATQRPSVDVITGLIKANFPCRIAFQVASKVDSRTIIDCNGAETLLGNGDMLFLPPGVGAPVRLHGSFISTGEIEAIVEHVSRQPAVEGLMELPDPMEEAPRELELTPASRDELFEEAARLVAIHQQGSVSLLQRKLKVGYARAARLIDQLEAAGIVGPFDGSKARKVMVNETWLPEMGFGREE